MEQTDRPTGWHADLDVNKYRYWDGERWAFTASARDLDAYRAAGQVARGVDFQAPIHSELPPEEKPRRLHGPMTAALLGAAVVALVVTLLVVL